MLPTSTNRQDGTKGYGDFCQPCCRILSDESLVEKLTTHLTRPNNTLNAQGEYPIEAVIQLGHISRLKAGSDSRCRFCTFIFHGSAKFQRSLTRPRKDAQGKAEDIVCIESPSAVLSEQSDDYIYQLEHCNVYLAPHTRTDPQMLRRQGWWVVVVVVPTPLPIPLEMHYAYFDESWIRRTCIPTCDHRPVPAFIQPSTFQRWLRECETEHGTCLVGDIGPKQSAIQPSNRCFRLIHTSRRVILEFESTRTLSYATLSYVWGSQMSRSFLLTRNWVRENQRSAEGPPCIALPPDLPRTFVDAITLAHELGIPFLWIDALCIIQDDLADASAQIGNMASIYAQARVCIISAAGDDVRAGLPGVSSKRTSHVRRACRIGERLFLGRANKNLSDVLQSSKWKYRAWTYQEFMLSPRCLLFTNDEVIFLCGRLTYREGRGDSFYQRQEDLLSWDSGSLHNLATLFNGSEEKDLAAIYASCVEEYSGRQLSRESDALLGFGGILDQISSHYDTNIICGLPTKILLYGLMWAIKDYGNSSSRRRRQRIFTGFDSSVSMSSSLFPSWCWAAFSSAIIFPTVTDYWTGREAIIPGSELGVLADRFPVSVQFEGPGEDFCWASVATPQGIPVTEVQHLLPCVARLSKLPMEDVVLREGYPESGRTKTHHNSLHGKTIGWFSLDESSTNVPPELHFIQFCTSKRLSHRLTCHVMLVALQEQGKSTLRTSLGRTSFDQVFLDGCNWASFADIHDTQHYKTKQDLYDIEREGIHPDFLRRCQTDEVSVRKSVEQGASAGLKEVLSFRKEVLGIEQSNEESTGNDVCAECRRLISSGNRFKTTRPNQEGVTPLYLARRLGVGEIVLDAWEAAKPVTAALLLG